MVQLSTAVCLLGGKRHVQVCEACFCVLFPFKVCRRLEGLSVQICDDGMRHSETRRENDRGLIDFVCFLSLPLGLTQLFS